MVAPQLWTSDRALSARVEHRCRSRPAPPSRTSRAIWTGSRPPTRPPSGAPPTSPTWNQVDVGACGLARSRRAGRRMSSWAAERRHSGGVSPSSAVTYVARRTPVGLSASPEGSVSLEAAGSGRYSVLEHPPLARCRPSEVGTVLVERDSDRIRLLDDAGNSGTIVELAGRSDFVDMGLDRVPSAEPARDDDRATSRRPSPTPVRSSRRATLRNVPVETGFLAFRIDTDSPLHLAMRATGGRGQKADRLRTPMASRDPQAQELNTDWLWGRHERHHHARRRRRSRRALTRLAIHGRGELDGRAFPLEWGRTGLNSRYRLSLVSRTRRPGVG